VKYNILWEQWLFMVFKDSSTKRLSMIDALCRGKSAHLAYCNPMDRIAVLRFLLAVMYWCWKETGEPIHRDGIPQAWVKYLESSANYFEFMGDGKRLMQKIGLTRLRPVSELIHEIPTGNNFWHFNHVRDYTVGICTHCLVSSTLRLPLFFVSGRPNLKSGINGSPPIYAVRWGKNLWDTIYLNWKPREPLGNPIWVEPYRFNPEDDVPLLSGMTVPARLLHIDDPIPCNKSCSVCGEQPGYLHYTCKFEAAGNLENSIWRDPFELRPAEKAIKASAITGSGKLKYDVKHHRLLPQIIDSLSIESGSKILLVGFAVDKAKYVDIWERTISIPDRDKAEDTIEIIREWDKLIKRSMANTYLPTKEARKNRARKLKESLQNDLLPDVDMRIAKLLPELLAGRLAWEAISNEYYNYAKTAAKTLSNGIGTKQIMDRSRIAYSLPRAVPSTESESSQGGKS